MGNKTIVFEPVVNCNFIAGFYGKIVDHRLRDNRP
jgi:hypothetical protein